MQGHLPMSVFTGPDTRSQHIRMGVWLTGRLRTKFFRRLCRTMVCQALEWDIDIPKWAGNLVISIAFYVSTKSIDTRADRSRKGILHQ